MHFIFRLYLVICSLALVKRLWTICILCPCLTLSIFTKENTNNARIRCKCEWIIGLSGLQFLLNWVECSLVWNHPRDFINSQREFDWNHKYDFISKLQDTKFNQHFITSILKQQNLVTQYKVFSFCSHILLIQYIEPVYKKLQKLSLIFLQFDWFIWKSLEIWLVVMF